MLFKFPTYPNTLIHPERGDIRLIAMDGKKGQTNLYEGGELQRRGVEMIKFWSRLVTADRNQS